MYTSRAGDHNTGGIGSKGHGDSNVSTCSASTAVTGVLRGILTRIFGGVQKDGELANWTYNP